MSNSFSDPSYAILRAVHDFKEATGQPVANTDVPEADLSAFYSSPDDPQYNADIEKYGEQRQHLRGLAHEEIVQADVEGDQGQVQDRPGKALKARGEAL